MTIDGNNMTTRQVMTMKEMTAVVRDDDGDDDYNARGSE